MTDRETSGGVLPIHIYHPSDVIVMRDINGTVVGYAAHDHQTMTTLTVPDSPKMLRETLCVSQSALGLHPDESRRGEHIARLQRLADECDRHRPLGPDGKHGDLHTPTCGCEDK